MSTDAELFTIGQLAARTGLNSRTIRWQLLGMLNGQPPFPPAVPAFEWLIAALREGS